MQEKEEVTHCGCSSPAVSGHQHALAMPAVLLPKQEGSSYLLAACIPLRATASAEAVPHRCVLLSGK
eukprot:scaffold146517_cov24-Tisochrysis_lutea.AAC.1